MSTELVENPFVVLALPMTATNEDIVAAYEDQLAASPDRESELMAARRALLSPKLRLAAEIAFLPGTPEADAAAVLRALRSRAPSLGEALALASRLPPLARSNVLLHAIQTFGPDPVALFDFVEARAGVDPDAVRSAIDSARATAGTVPVQADAFGAELSRWGQRQHAALFERPADTGLLAETLPLVTTRTLALRDDRHNDALDEVLQAYWRRVSAEAAQIRSRLSEMRAHIAAEQTPPDVQAFADTLRAWQKLAYPLQALESAKGREEPESQAVFRDARDIYIAVANDLDLPEAALALAIVIDPAVAMLARASAQLSDDILLLHRVHSEQRCHKLFDALDVIRNDVEVEGGASAQVRSDLATPEWRAVWIALEEAVEALGPESETPWAAVRQLNLFLFNDALQKRLAQAVTLRLQTLAAMSAPPSFRELLTKDVSDMERFLLEDELGALVDQGKWNKAARAVRELIQRAPDAATAASYTELRTQIETKQRGRIGAWVTPIVIAAGLAIVSQVNRTSQRQASPPPVAVTAPSGIPSASTSAPSFGNAAEERPPVTGESGGLLITQANVRYCVFEDARLEHLRGLVSSSETLVRRFNAAVEDWNSRCSRYRYRPSDMARVEREVAERADGLRAEARSRLAEWR